MRLNWIFFMTYMSTHAGMSELDCLQVAFGVGKWYLQCLLNRVQCHWQLWFLVRVGQMKQMPTIWLLLTLAICALERELKRSSARKSFLSFHRQVGLLLETIRGLQVVGSFDLRDYLALRLETIQVELVDDIPRSKICISWSPLAARTAMVVIWFCLKCSNIIFECFLQDL